MSASITSPKEISSLLKLAAAALDDIGSLDDDERQDLVGALDRTAHAIDVERGVEE